MSQPKKRSSSPVFVAALNAALRRPIAWMFGFAGVTGMALVASLPVYRWFADTTANHYAPGDQLHHLDRNFRTDHAEGLAQLLRTVGTSADWMMVLAVLLGIFSAGGWLRTLVDPRTHAARRLFFAGGARYYWRFARLAVLVILVLGVLGTLLRHPDSLSWQNEVLAGWPQGRTERATSELSVVWMDWIRNGVHLLLFSLVTVWATYTRTRIVLQNSGSVVVSGFSSLWLLLRHPIATLRPFLILTMLELVLLQAGGGIGRLVQGGLESGGMWRVTLLFAIGGVLIVAREIFDGARYAASVAVSRSFVRPIAIDPWSDRIGGPGGPQYPVGPDDDYSIAV
ncbi:MAG: hypothetical protein R3F34_16110 [Planctomycetota bacterium]